MHYTPGRPQHRTVIPTISAQPVPPATELHPDALAMSFATTDISWEEGPRVKVSVAFCHVTMVNYITRVWVLVNQDMNAQQVLGGLLSPRRT